MYYRSIVRRVCLKNENLRLNPPGLLNPAGLLNPPGLLNRCYYLFINLHMNHLFTIFIF